MLPRIPRIARTWLPSARSQFVSGRSLSRQSSHSYDPASQPSSHPASLLSAPVASGSRLSAATASTSSSHRGATRTSAYLAALVGAAGLAAAWYCHQSSDESPLSTFLSSLPSLFSTAECTTGVTTRKWRQPTRHTPHDTIHRSAHTHLSPVCRLSHLRLLSRHSQLCRDDRPASHQRLVPPRARC